MYSRQNNILTEDILREYIRKSIIIEQRRILEENILRKALDWTKSTIKTAKEKKDSLKKSIPQFLKNLRDFFSKQKSGAKILKKLLAGKKLSRSEMDELKEQVKDLFMGTALLGLFVLPLGGLAITALVKYGKEFNIEVLPTSFRQQPVNISELSYILIP